MNKRLFVSIDIPQYTRERLVSESEKIFPENEWRHADKDNLHITLAFLGSVPEEKIDDIKVFLEDAARDIKHFTVEINKIILGGGSRNKTMVWAEIDKNTVLESLAYKIKQGLYDIGFESLKKDTDRFTPHITLARKRNPLKKSSIPDDLSISVSEVFTAKSVDLMESTLGNVKLEYIKLSSAQLNEG